MKKKTLYLANVNHLFCIYMDQFSVIPISRVPGQPRVLPEILGPSISCEDLQNKQSFIGQGTMVLGVNTCLVITWMRKVVGSNLGDGYMLTL